MTKALDLIEAMDRILDSEESWTKGEIARDYRGFRVPASSKEAARFCLSGALVRAYSEAKPALRLDIMEDARAALRTAIGPHNDRDDLSIPLIPYFNDRPSTTFKDVKRVIAIARTNELSKTLS